MTKRFALTEVDSRLRNIGAPLEFRWWPTIINDSGKNTLKASDIKSTTSQVVFITTEPRVVKFKGYFKDVTNDSVNLFSIGYTDYFIRKIKEWSKVKTSEFYLGASSENTQVLFNSQGEIETELIKTLPPDTDSKFKGAVTTTPSFIRINQGIDIIGYIEAYDITIINTHDFGGSKYLITEAEVSLTIKEVDPRPSVVYNNRRFQSQGGVS